jgi:hypothetical protein
MTYGLELSRRSEQLHCKHDIWRNCRENHVFLFFVFKVKGFNFEPRHSPIGSSSSFTSHTMIHLSLAPVDSSKLSSVVHRTALMCGA